MKIDELLEMAFRLNYGVRGMVGSGRVEFFDANNKTVLVAIADEKGIVPPEGLIILG